MIHTSLLLYIDPGTGAMLFTVVIGLLTTAYYALRKVGVKLKFLLSGGRVKDTENTDKQKLIIFSDHKRYWNVFGPICDELEKRKIDCLFWTASEDDPALDQNYEHVKCSFIGSGNKAYARLNIMNAYLCLATTPGLDVYQWKRSKKTDYYVHTLHSPSVPMYRMFGLDFFDAVLLNGEFQLDPLRKLENMRNLPAKEMPVVGSIYLDAMKSKKEKLIYAERSAEDKRRVLLAPSWGKSAILSVYGERFLKALEDTGYDITVRPHPQSLTAEKALLERLEKQFPESENWHWNYDNDNFDVLSRSDIMISDFSGVILDIAFIFDKPVIYTDTGFDPSPYDAYFLERPLWIEQVLPKIGHKLVEEDIENIKEVIDSTILSEGYREGRKEVRDTAWEYENEATVKTVDYLEKKIKELTAVNEESSEQEINNRR